MYYRALLLRDRTGSQLILSNHDGADSETWEKLVDDKYPGWWLHIIYKKKELDRKPLQ